LSKNVVIPTMCVVSKEKHFLTYVIDMLKRSMIVRRLIDETRTNTNKPNRNFFRRWTVRL